MPATPHAEQHSSPRIKPETPWDVVAVAPQPGYRLSVDFADGTSGDVDMSRLIRSENAGVFASLRDPKVFAEARVELGAVTWPGNLDIAPDAMYDAIRTSGRWIVE